MSLLLSVHSGGYTAWARPPERSPSAPMVRTRRSVGPRPFAGALARPRGPLLCLLGSPAILAGTHLSPLRLRPKALALIAYLTLAGGPCPRRDLARLVFPEAEEPLGILRWYLAYVRSAAPAAVTRQLRSTRDSIALSIPTDVALFRAGAQVVSRRPETPNTRWRSIAVIS